MKQNRLIWIVAGILLIEFLSGGVWGIHRGLSSLFAKEVLMITSFTQIGLVVSVFGIAKAVTNLGFGALSDRVGRKPVIILGLISSGVGGAMIASAKDFYGMLFGTALIGLGGGSTFVGIMVSMIEAVPSRIGLAMGLFELAAYGGSTFGTAFAGYLAVAQGFRLPFQIIMFLSFAGAVTGFFLVPETKGFVKGENTAATRVSWRYSSALIRLMPLYFAGFSSKIMDGLIWSFLPLLLLGLRMSIEGAATVLAAFTFSWAILQPFSGHLSDKLGRKRLTVVGLTIAAVGILTFTLTSEFVLMLIFALILGVGAALFYTPIIAMVSDIAPPELEGTLIGSYRFFRDMGYFVGPILLGSVADRYGLGYAFYVTSLILFIAMIILQILSKETLKPSV